jgi:hypothetical protein
MRFTMRRLMIGIALCALSLAVLREVPIIAVLIGPLIGSLWEVRKGGKGLTGGLIGGAITWGGIGLVLGLIETFKRHTRHEISSSDEIILLLILFVSYPLAGAVIGLAEGIAVCYLRHLATMPRRLRLRAERSARANAYRPTSRAG